MAFAVEAATFTASCPSDRGQHGLSKTSTPASFLAGDMAHGLVATPQLSER